MSPVPGSAVRRPRTRCRGVGLLSSVVPAVLVLLLGACTGDDAASSGPTAVTAPAGPAWGYPAVAAGQVQQLDTAADTALAAAVSQRDTAAAAGRVTGPAAQLLDADLAVAKARGRAPEQPTRLAPSVVLVPQAGPWPRWFVSAGTAPGHPTPVVRVLRSASPREPYAVWAELAVLPGATVPAPLGDPAGAPSLGPTGTGLVMTPAQVAVRYADVLNRGRASTYAAAFADDAFRGQLGDRLAADRKRIVSSAVATVLSAHAPVAGTGWGVRTADGGALVVVELRQSYRVTVDARGGVVRADAELAALAGREEFTRGLVRTSTEVLAFAVPAARATAASSPVRLVAAVKGDVAVTGS